MNIGIRLHDTAPGTLKERLGFARAQGFTCAHVALGMTLPGFSMQDAPRQLTSELAARVRQDLRDTGMETSLRHGSARPTLRFSNRVQRLTMGIPPP